MPDLLAPTFRRRIPYDLQAMKFRLRTLVIVVCLLSVSIAFLAARKRTRQNLIAKLEADQLGFETSEETCWFDQLPIIGAGDSVVALSHHSNSKLTSETIHWIKQVGTVTKLDYREIEYEELQLLSKIKTIKEVRYRHGYLDLPKKHASLFSDHPISSFSTDGALIPAESLEILYSIPTLELIGTRWGHLDVPKELTKLRPDVKVSQTDMAP